MLFLLAERIILLEKKEETLNLEIRLKTNIGNIFTTWNIFEGNFSLFILAVYERLWSCLTVLPPSCDWLPVVRMIVSRRVSGRAWTSWSDWRSHRCLPSWLRDRWPPPRPWAQVRSHCNIDFFCKLLFQDSDFRIYSSSPSSISYILKIFFLIFGVEAKTFFWSNCLESRVLCKHKDLTWICQ